MWATRSLGLMLLPGMILILVFNYAPMVGLIIAFKDYKLNKGIMGSEWVGLDNFRLLFDTKNSIQVIQNTLLISVYKLVWGIPAPILLALLINEVRNGPFKRFTQSVSYLPHFISWVVLGSIVYSVLSPSTGIVNLILESLGFEKIYFMTDKSLFRSILVGTNVWKEVGWGTILYLAGLAGISSDLYEAATLDGASRFRRMRDISLPLIMPVVAIVTVLSLSGILSAGFDQVFNLYNVQVYKVGDIIDTYVYRQGLIELQYSFATAVGLFKGLIGLVLVFGANWLARRASNGRYGLW
jgi:putative aldouronate transport system permease protein